MQKVEQILSLSVWTAEECGVQAARHRKNNSLYKTVTRSVLLGGAETRTSPNIKDKSLDSKYLKAEI